MADDFQLKWDAQNEQLYGEDPDTGQTVPVPIESIQSDSVDTDSLRGEWPSEVIALSGNGVETTIDPDESSSDTIINDAINATGFGAKILVPEGTDIDNTGAPLQLKNYCSIIGLSQNQTKILLPTSGVAVTNQSSGTQFDVTIKDVSLQRESVNSSPAPFIEFTDTLRQFEMDRTNCFFNYGPFLSVPNGTAPFEWTFGRVFIGQMDAGDSNGIIDWQGTGRAIKFENIAIYPEASQSSSLSTIVHHNGRVVGGLELQTVNIGGSAGRVYSSQNASSYADIGQFNYEPTDSAGESLNSLIYLTGYRGETFVRSPDITSSAVDFDYVYEINGANNAHLYPLVRASDESGSFVNQIEITAEPSQPRGDDISVYYGDSSDIDNTAGSSTGAIRSMASAGSGNG